MTNWKGQDPDQLSDVVSAILGNLMPNSDSLLSVFHETGVGRFFEISQSFVMTPGEIRDYVFTSPGGFLTLFSSLYVNPSSPIVQLVVLKDEVAEVDIQGFSDYDKLLPNVYTPVRNRGIIRFYNTSGISSPSVVFTLRQFTIQGIEWARFRNLLDRVVRRAVGTGGGGNG